MTKEDLLIERENLRKAIKPAIDRLFIINTELELCELKGQLIGILARQNEPITTVEILDIIYPPNTAIEMKIPEYRRKMIMSLSFTLHRLCKSQIVKSQTIKGHKGKSYQIINK